MTDYILDISENPARLYVENNLLVIAREDGKATFPLNEIAAIVISHPAVNLSLPALSRLAAKRSARRMPVRSLWQSLTILWRGECTNPLMPSDARERLC